MTRFTSNEKYEAVLLYKSGKYSYADISKKIGVAKSSIVKWVTLYEAHGLEGLSLTYTKYSVEFKIDVLNYMNETGASLLETAAAFKIPSPDTISKWRQRVERNGLDALRSKKRGRREMKKLKKTPHEEGSKEALLAELEYLRAENAYLKKLNALVQEKEKLQKKTSRK
jgi:transposase